MQPFYAPSHEHPWYVLRGDRTSVEDLTSVTAILAAVDVLDSAQHDPADPDAPPWMITVGCAQPTSYLSLNMGVGVDRVPVYFNGDYAENAISVSDSAEDKERDEELVYKLYGDYSWCSSANLVDYADARAALEQFLTTGQRPTGIEWEDL